jgi:hypothetical protein
VAWWQIHKRDRPGSTAGSAVLASAALITSAQVRSVVGKRQEWQAQGWEWYRSVPELKSGIRWSANGLSRARLYIGRIDPDGSSKPVPVDAQDVDGDVSPDTVSRLLAPLEDLAGGQLGQAEMLRRLSVHLDIPGESYLLGYDDPHTGARRWIICSPSEITSTGGGGSIRVQLPESQASRLDLPLDQCTLIRLWRPDDEFAYLPDSPLQGLQDPLKEIQGLTAHVLATVDSRLAGAGLGLISDDVTPASPQQSDGVNPLHSDPVTSALIEAAGASLRNRDSAAALVPILLRTPGSVEDKFKWSSFATELDKMVLPLRDAAVKRLAIGLDMPPEYLIGLGETNHWNADEISDDSVRLHLEPKLGLICDAFTSRYFRPAWKALGVPNPERWACWYDTSDLKQRPNRAPEAAEAHSRGAISDAAYLRELGFSDEDLPDEDEQRRRLLVQVATNNAQLAPAALAALGIDLPDAAQAASADPSRPPAEISRPSPAPAELPQNEPPPQPELTASAVEGIDWRMRCLDLAVRRALGRAGQWLLNNGSRSLRGQFRGVPHDEIYLRLRAEEHQLDSMLSGAYTDFHASTPEPYLHHAIDLYVRRLLLTGIAHEHAYLADVLAEADWTRRWPDARARDLAGPAHA